MFTIKLKEMLNSCKMNYLMLFHVGRSAESLFAFRALERFFTSVDLLMPLEVRDLAKIRQPLL